MAPGFFVRKICLTRFGGRTKIISMGQLKREDLPAFSELERRVKALRASEKALQNEVDRLREQLTATEAELKQAQAVREREERRRAKVRVRLDELIHRLSDLPALREAS